VLLGVFFKVMMGFSSKTVVLVVSQFFWFFATLDVVVSIGIEVWVRTARSRSLKADRLTSLAIGQRKDTWLVCAIVWIFLLCDGLPMQWLLQAAGTVILLWLLRRTAQRMRTFARGE